MAKSVLDIDYPQDQDHEPEQIHAPEQPHVSGHTRLERNALGIDCVFDRHSDKLLRKTERRVGDASTTFVYEFDSTGRLCKVTRNGSLAEEYHYNQAGQRVYQCLLSGNRSENSADGESTLEYDEEGLLRRAGKTYFAYNPDGAVAVRRDRQGDTKYFYGRDTGLDRIKLPDGTEISYAYSSANPDNPVKRLWHDCPVAEYTWQDPLRLTAYRDHELELDYAFTYAPDGVLDRVRITPKLQRRARTPPPDADWVDAGPIGVYRENTPPPAPDQADNLDEWLRALADRRARTIYKLFEKHGAPLTLYCACDQVGTLKLLTDKNGNLVKEVLRDSFGVLYYDSLPDLFIPIGFAGGLTDPDTDLIRFGKRDYDPNIGRFTAPDPARDLRGDGDLYDYCADDPVSRKDPTGLAWWTPRWPAEELRGTTAATAAPQGVPPQSVPPRGAAPRRALSILDMVDPQVQNQVRQAFAQPLAQPPAQEQTSRPLRREPAPVRPMSVLDQVSPQGHTSQGQTSRSPMRPRTDGGEWSRIFMREEPRAVVREQIQSQADSGNLPEWKLDVALQALQKNVLPASKSKCSKYVRMAIEAGGIRLDLSLNSANGDARGFGPVLEGAGFRPMPPGTEPQAGDVAVFDAVPGHPRGHAGMFNGLKWISDFEQKDVYPGDGYRSIKAPYILYRRPQ